MKMYRDESLELVWAFKSEPCTDCGHRFHPCAMQFDHVRGEKKSHVSKIRHGGGMNFARFLEEIEKCELVCSNCHAIRTFKRAHGGDLSLFKKGEVKNHEKATHSKARTG